MRSRLLALVLAMIASSDARADDGTRLLVDRVSLEPTSDGAVLYVDFAVVAHRGQSPHVAIHAGDLELIDGVKAKTVAPLGDESAPLVLAILVQANVDNVAVLPTIIAALETEVLSHLDERARVAIMPYGGASGAGKLLGGPEARARLRAVVADASAGPAALLDTLDRALNVTSTAPGRRVVVIVGDGRDRDGDNQRVTALAQRAHALGVRIDSIGFSATQARRSLLSLGELGRHTQGVFRWVETGGAQWQEIAEQLRMELVGGSTAQFEVRRELAGTSARLRVASLDAGSIAIEVPALACGGRACPAGVCDSTECVVPPSFGRRIAKLVAIVVGLFVALSMIGYALERRKIARHPAPVLYVTSTQQLVSVRNGFVIGRARRSQLVVDDSHASNRHAIIRLDHHGWKLTDLGSANGTLVDGVRVQEAVLVAGMTIVIGRTELRVVPGGRA